MVELGPCPKCGGYMIAVVGTPGVLASCEDCGYLLHGVGDPALQEWVPDFREAELVLDSVGPSALSVASAIRAVTGVTPRAALSLVRSDHPVIARRPAFHIRELEALKSELEVLGAACTLRRLP